MYQKEMTKPVPAKASLPVMTLASANANPGKEDKMKMKMADSWSPNPMGMSHGRSMMYKTIAGVLVLITIGIIVAVTVTQTNARNQGGPGFGFGGENPSYLVENAIPLLGLRQAVQNEYNPFLNAKDFVYNLTAAPIQEGGAGGTIQGATAATFPGLMGTSTSAALVTIRQGGLNQPHTHPRASEVIFVTAGEFLIGFVDSQGNNVNQRVMFREMFVVPQGLIHYEYNSAPTGDSVFLAFFPSDAPGVISTHNRLLSVLPQTVIRGTLGVTDAFLQGTLVAERLDNPSLLADAGVTPPTSLEIDQIVLQSRVFPGSAAQTNWLLDFEADLISGVDYRTKLNIQQGRLQDLGLGGTIKPGNGGTFPPLRDTGISCSFVEILPCGLNQPHTHPRATELLYVVDGSFIIGIVDSLGNNFNQITYKGELFVVPQGQIHYEVNQNSTISIFMAFFNSQAPSVIGHNRVFQIQEPLVISSVYQMLEEEFNDVFERREENPSLITGGGSSCLSLLTALPDESRPARTNRRLFETNTPNKSLIPKSDLYTAAPMEREFRFPMMQSAVGERGLGGATYEANINTFPALENTGISASLTNLERCGVQQPHVHPRASEIIYVNHGRIGAGFVTSGGVAYNITLDQGDIWVVPQGLMHWTVNLNEDGVSQYISAYNNPLPGNINTNFILETPDIVKYGTRGFNLVNGAPYEQNIRNNYANPSLVPLGLCEEMLDYFN